MPLDPASLRLRYLLALGLAPLTGCGSADTECLLPAETGECPTQAEAATALVGEHCGYAVNAVTGPGTLQEVANTWESGSQTLCCYPTLESQDVLTTCVVGRPYLEDGRMKTAPARRGRGWARGRRPDVAALTAVERAVLARAWTEDALVEHASVAAFARTTLELMAAGAPADLLAAVQAAAADEVRHARVSFALAEAYAGAPVAAGAFPLPSAVVIETDLPRLAASTFREGCVGETVVAILSARAAADATDPAAQALLRLVARDEARHAELAWRTLDWLLRAGGAAAHAAVSEAVEGLLREGVQLTQITAGADDAVLRAHGRIRPAAAFEARERAVREVILPCIRARLAAGAGTTAGVNAEA